jgi:hypothetical protein
MAHVLNPINLKLKKLRRTFHNELLSARAMTSRSKNSPSQNSRAASESGLFDAMTLKELNPHKMRLPPRGQNA